VAGTKKKTGGEMKKEKKFLLQKMQDEERQIKHLVRKIMERRGTASKEGSKFWQSFINNTSPGGNFRNKSSYDMNNHVENQNEQGKEGDDISIIKEKDQDNIGDFELLLPAFFTEILHKKDLEKAYHDLDSGNLCDSQNNYLEVLQAIRVGLDAGVKVLESCSSKKGENGTNNKKLSSTKCSAEHIETMLANIAHRVAPSVPLREVDGKLDHDRCTEFKDQGWVTWSTWLGHWYNKKIYKEKYRKYYYSSSLQVSTPRVIYNSSEEADDDTSRKFKSKLALLNNRYGGPAISFDSQVPYYPEESFSLPFNEFPGYINFVEEFNKFPRDIINKKAISEIGGHLGTSRPKVCVSHTAKCANDFVEEVAKRLADELTSCLDPQNNSGSCLVQQSAAFELSGEIMYAHLLPNANVRWSVALNFVMAVLMQEIPSVMLTTMSPHLRGPALDVLRKLDPDVPAYQVKEIQVSGEGDSALLINESLVVGQLFAKYFLEKAKAGSLSRQLLQPRTEAQGKTQLRDLDKTIWGYVAKYFPDGVESSNVIKYNYLANLKVQECENQGYHLTKCLEDQMD